MKEIASITVVFGILLSLFAQLEVQANMASDQVLEFTNDMNMGLECVLDGKLLVDCQPDLFEDYGFNENLNTTSQILNDFTDEYS